MISFSPDCTRSSTCWNDHFSFPVSNTEASKLKLILFQCVFPTGYACTPYLLTPYTAPITEAQRRFNVAHKKSRCIIERLFGMVKRRFPSLSFGIRMQPDRTCRVIMACFVLHNIALSRRKPDFDEDEIAPFEEEEYDNQLVRQENLAQEILRLRRQCFAKRQRITLNDFSR